MLGTGAVSRAVRQMLLGQPTRHEATDWRESIRLNDGVLAVAVDNPHLGFFAHMNVLVHLLRAAEDVGATARIRFLSSNYVDRAFGPDWLPYFFHPSGRPDGRPRMELRVKTHRDFELPSVDDMALDHARAVLFRHLEVKDDVTRSVDAFCSNTGIGEGTIGVHYRGTDKAAEAARVSYDAALDAVEAAAGSSDERIFVATDEAGFLAAIENRFGAHRIASHPVHRSTDDRPLHLNGAAPAGIYDMGLSALIDCLTLARCGHLVRTCSLLSSWASVFNPSIRVTLLSTANEDTNWWPERMIASSGATMRA